MHPEESREAMSGNENECNKGEREGVPFAGTEHR